MKRPRDILSRLVAAALRSRGEFPPHKDGKGIEEWLLKNRESFIQDAQLERKKLRSSSASTQDPSNVHVATPRSDREEERSIQELVRKAQSGCGTALGRLFDFYGPRLKQLILLRLSPALRSRLEVEDILQEALIRAFRALRGFQWSNAAAFFRWLASITDHSILTTVRQLNGLSRRRAATLELCDEDYVMDRAASMESSDAACSASRTLLSSERFAQLEAALNSLSPASRQLVVMAKIHGLSMQEIADQLGITTGAASMRLLRAIRKLRLTLENGNSLRSPPSRFDRLPDVGK